MAIPFPEAVARERSTEPLPADATPSMKLRRELLHGRKVSPGTAEQFGATKSLVYVLVRTMRDWGFQVGQEDVEGGDTHYFITNLEFVPTERVVAAVRRPYVPKGERSTGGGGGKNWAKMTDGVPEGLRVIDPKSTRAALIKRLAGGDVLTAKMVKEQHDTDPSMLRKVISAFEEAGYAIHRDKIDGQRAFGVDLSVPRKTNGSTSTKKAPKKQRTPQHAVERTPIPTVPMASSPGVGGDWQPAVNGLTPVPQLDEGLVVFLTYRDDDGDVRVGIRNGDERWLCRVEGHVDIGAFSPG